MCSMEFEQPITIKTMVLVNDVVPRWPLSRDYIHHDVATILTRRRLAAREVGSEILLADRLYAIIVSGAGTFVLLAQRVCWRFGASTTSLLVQYNIDTTYL